MDAHPIEPRLRNALRESLDAEHGPYPVWAGSPAARRVTETQRSRWPLRAVTAAAAVLVVAIGAFQLLPGGLGSGGATATTSPSPALLARGDFAIADGGYVVELEAFGQGSSVTGRMVVSEPVSQPGIDTVFTVQLQCTRSTDDGAILIGGVTTEGNGVAPEGTWAAIALRPGSPVGARVLSQRGGPASDATSCTAYLDEKVPVWGTMTGLVRVEGTIEVGLPVGPHVMGSRWHGEDRVTMTIPAPGWFEGSVTVYRMTVTSVTKDLGGGDRVTVTVVPGDYYSMPRSICNWHPIDAYLDDEISTADEFVEALARQTYDTPAGSSMPDYSASEAISVDGSHGQRITNVATAYPDSDPSACDEQRLCILRDRDRGRCLLSPEPGALDTLWIVDPPEDRGYFLVVAASGSPDPALRDEMNALVNSMTFHVE